MRRRVLILLLLAMPLLLAAPLSADEVYLKSGTVVRGKIVSEGAGGVEIKLDSGEVRSIPKDDIALVRKGTSPVDEFRDRMKAVADGDVEGLLGLAAWCDEQNLPRQRVTVLRKLVEADPDCPEARRGLLECWNGTKWAKDARKGEVDPPKAGETVKAEKIGLEVKVPAGLKATDAGEKGLTLAGPERYRFPVRIEVVPLVGTAKAHFPEKEGWSGPEPVRYGPLEGLVSAREWKDGTRRLKVREHAVTGNGWSLLFRVSALSCEIGDWTSYLDFVLANMTVLAPKLDFVYERANLGFRFPKDQGWQIGTTVKEEDPLLIFMMHQGDRGSLDFGQLVYAQQAADESTPPDPAALLGGMTGSGDVLSKQKTTLGPLAAEVWEYAGLFQGFPIKGLALVAIDGKKIHTIVFFTHEQSFDTYRTCFDRVRESFTFGVKK